MLDRRKLLLGGAAFALSGCKVLDGANDGQGALRDILESVSPLTHRAQRLIAGNALAPEYAEADIRQGQRPNGSTDPDSPEYLALARGGFADYALKVTGLVEKPLSLPLRTLQAMPARTQITRHDCVEGWSCIAKWTGVPLAHVLAEARPLPHARLAVFHCHDTMERGLSGEVKYYESIGLDEAYHPQTILAYGLNGDPLPVANGAPLRVRVERQLGYKMAKYVHTIELVDSFAPFGGGKGGYWEDRGYQWYGGI